MTMPVLLRAALALWAAAGHAAEPDACSNHGGTPIHKEPVQALWDSVRVAIGLPLVAEPPVACIVPPEEIARLKLKDEGFSGNALQALALYDRANARILIAAPWDVTDTVAQSMLLHELVHHAQALLGRRYPCQGAFEAEAYAMQEAWLEARGFDLEMSIGLDPLARILLTNCGI